MENGGKFIDGIQLQFFEAEFPAQVAQIDFCHLIISQELLPLLVLYSTESMIVFMILTPRPLFFFFLIMFRC